MATKTDKNVILLPIFPRYAKAIIEGKKKVEFRKLNIPMNIGHVVIYSTSPEKKVVGFFRVPKVTRATPKQLWRDFKQVGHVEEEFLIDYFAGHKYGLAIHIGKVSRVKKPFALGKIRKQNPPQSFMYLENDVLEMIKSGQA